MRQKIMVVAFAAFLGTGLAVVSESGQQQAQSLEISEVADGLYVITGSGGNVGVRVTGDGAIVIDDKFDRNYDEIIANIESVTDEPVKYVINTHHHGDHSGSNAQFANIAQVIAHKNARTNILRNDQPGPPSVIFTNETAVFLGDAEVQAHHMGRGHTNGDAVIYFPDLGVIHGGDLLNTGNIFIDYNNGGSFVEWVDTLDNMLALDFTTAIPGHGEILTKDEVRAYRNKFAALETRARELISQGMSPAEFVANLQTSDLGWDLAGRGGAGAQGVYAEVSQSME
jgi:cyclase